MVPKTPRPRRSRGFTVFLSVVGVVVFLAVVAAGLGVWTVQRSFPQLSGTIDVPGLTSDVTVSRDEAGVPQITADNSDDLFRAQGYVHAQDRFWEMDFRRHVTAGRLSEWFGESQVSTDAFIRTLGWRDVAEAEVEALDDTTLGYYEAYAAGVNAYLSQRSGADLSLEYAILGLQIGSYTPEPWTPADSVAWLKAMAWDMRSNLETEIDRALLAEHLTPEQIAQLYPSYPYDSNPVIVPEPAPASVPSTKPTASDVATGARDDLVELKRVLQRIPALLGPQGADLGSNSWVVSGEHTITGMPMLANDPHLGPAMPSIWYQVGLRCSEVSDACPFDVAGFSFSGLPGIVIGHNSSIAWGFTNLGPDVTDLYIERVDGDTYELDGVQVPLEVRTETIGVAGGADVVIEVRSTGRGPIVSRIDETYREIADTYPTSDEQSEGDSAVSLQWTALTPGNTPAAIFAVNRSTTWEEFREASRLFDVPSQNLVYADVDGNIGYQAPGRIPVRLQGDGTVPQPGWSSSYGWGGYVPFERLPTLLNPDDGYIATANNAVVGPDASVFLTRDWDAGYRAARIDDRLAGLVFSEGQVTLSDMEALQNDTWNAMAATIVPLLDELAAEGPAAEGKRLLAEWDYRDDASSAPSAYFNVFWKVLLEQTFAPKLPADMAPAGSSRWFQVVGSLLDDPSSPWWIDEAAGVAGRDDALLTALDSAWREASSLLGVDPDDWEWGELHTLTLRNATFGESGIGVLEALFNRGPFEVGGGSSVVNAAGWTASAGYEVDWVPSMRMVVDLDDFDRSRWVNLTGASGHAYHPNYVDQTELWQRGDSRPWAYTPDAIGQATVNTLTLRPAS